MLFEGDFAGGLETETEMAVRIGICVSNIDQSVVGNLTTFTGLTEWHELADLVVAALSDPTSEHRVVSVSQDFQGSEFFPQWPGTIEMVVKPWG